MEAIPGRITVNRDFAEILKELRDEQCCKQSSATPRAERGAAKSDVDSDGGSAVPYRGGALPQWFGYASASSWMDRVKTP